LVIVGQAVNGLGGGYSAVPAIGQYVAIAVISGVFLVIERDAALVPAGTADTGMLAHFLQAVQLVVMVGVANRAAQLVNRQRGVTDIAIVQALPGDIACGCRVF